MSGTETQQQTKTNILTGAQIFLECLKKEGVKEIFGYPGGVILSIYEALYNDKDIKHYLVRHEQAAVHAAEGYARVTGKPGVVLVTSGPGATNCITGIANAYYDGYPVVVFTGQVGVNQIGNDAFQEADIIGITRSCCKHNYLVKDVKDLPRIIKEAFHIATTGKPGPVVVDMPKDILTASTDFIWPENIKLPGYNPNYNGHPKQTTKALELLCDAERPVIIAGGGSAYIHATKEVAEMAAGLEGDEKTGANIVLKALEAPLYHIAANAGLEGSVIINKVKEMETGWGFDALKEAYVNMVDAGILDPAKVTRSALQNATSVASTLLTTESVVADIKEETPAAPAGAGGMGMM